MRLAESTVSSHRQICTDIGIFDQYQARLRSKNALIGGNSADDSQDHLLVRYLNSASRTQAILCIQDVKCQEMQEELLSQLDDGTVHIIDIAAGHGAGTLSVLNTVAEMRENGALLKNALNLNIYALDFSEISLNYYAAMVTNLTASYLSQGIVVKFHPILVDITSDPDVAASIAEIKQNIGGNPRYFLICSAISGVKEDVFRTKFSASYQIIAHSFKDRNSVFLWVEPRTKKMWIFNFWEEFSEKLGISKVFHRAAGSRMIRQNFAWLDPHNNIPQGNQWADFALMGLSKE